MKHEAVGEGVEQLRDATEAGHSSVGYEGEVRAADERQKVVRTDGDERDLGHQHGPRVRRRVEVSERSGGIDALARHEHFDPSSRDTLGCRLKVRLGRINAQRLEECSNGVCGRMDVRNAFSRTSQETEKTAIGDARSIRDTGPILMAKIPPIDRAVAASYLIRRTESW